MSEDDLKALGAWLISENTGVSSKTMAAIALGVDALNPDMDAPYDPGDFGRCFKLVKSVPGIRAHFERIGRIVPQFAGILENWDECASLYQSYLALGSRSDSFAREELYRRIKELRGDRDTATGSWAFKARA